MVGNDDAGAVHRQLLTALHLKAEAVQVLEGPDEPRDDAEGETGREQRPPPTV